MVSTRVILLLLCSLICVNSLTWPLKVTYIDQIDCCSPQNTIIEAVNAGFNVIALAFYQTGLGTADAALAWSQRMDNVTRANTIKKIHDAGAVLTVSLGGANDQRWEQADPVQLATTIANWAKEYQLDGVDFDLEHFGGFGAINGDDQQTIDWFSSLISTTRSILGPNGIISLAPLPPWFGPIGAPKCGQVPTPGCSWVGPTGGLTAVYKNVGQDIDYFFGQFYNQGACYTTEAGLFTESGPGCTTPGAYYPFTSVKEIAAAGIPMNKIVIGKPVDLWAGVGYTAPATLRQWIENSGKAMGWNAGVGIWEWWDVTGSVATPWLHAIYPSAGPSTQSPVTTPKPTQPTTAPTAAPTARPPPTEPTTRATPAPTAAPTVAPTAAPTIRPPPTEPTSRATPAPTFAPTKRPGHGKATPSPTQPTPAPATAAPTVRPTAPTVGPTVGPTPVPTKGPVDVGCTDAHMQCTGAGTYSTCARGIWQANQACPDGLVCQATEPYIYCVRP